MYETLLSFALIILTGILFRRLRIRGVDADSVRLAINTLVLNVFLPALCIKIVYASRLDIEAILVPVTACITIVTTMSLAYVVYRFLGNAMNLEPSEKGVLILGATFGNVTYLGLPVITGVYGQEAAKYALFYDLLATTPLLWLIGASLASKYGEGRGFGLRDSLKTIFSLPPLWGIGIGILLNIIRMPMPPFIIKTLDMLGGLVVPLMIFSIGLALSLPKVRHSFAIVPAVLIKLVIVPFISFGAAKILGLKGDALGACLIEGAMPTMVLSLLVAARFKLDVSLAAFLIVVTTTLSFITLPVAIYMARLT